jgi:nucleoside-diphosphate-sugar epimerase
MKRFLIIGGETFIGASLARRLVREGKDVHIVTQQRDSLWRLNDLMLSLRSHVVNLSSPDEVFSMLSSVKADIIINTISYGEEAEETDLGQTYDQNFFNLLLLVEQAKEVGFSCFINTGSCQEYGRKQDAFSEDSMTEPLSHLGLSKASATMYLLKEAKKNSLPIYTVRPFIPYGPFQSRDSFITKLFTHTMIDVKFNRYYANASHDFIYIDDLVNIYLAIVQQQPTDTPIINAGSGIPRKLRDVAHEFEGVWQHDLTIDWNIYSDIGFSMESIGRCYSDQTLANKKLHNLPPQMSLRDGLTTTFEWFIKNQIVYEDSRLNQIHQLQISI